jgi:hypothetical protein
VREVNPAYARAMLIQIVGDTYQAQPHRQRGHPSATRTALHHDHPCAEYADQGQDYNEGRYSQRVLHHLNRRAAAQGFALTPIHATRTPSV